MFFERKRYVVAYRHVSKKRSALKQHAHATTGFV